MVSGSLRMALLYPLTHPNIFFSFLPKPLTFYEPSYTMWMFLLWLYRILPARCAPCPVSLTSLLA